MRRTISYILLLIIVGGFAQNVLAQQQPFYSEIQQFKKQDSAVKPPSKAILFVGSSSFRMWKGVQDSFPTRTIINRAFGGSTFSDLIYYANDVIAPYKPKQILIYCGDNDLASSDTITPAIVLKRFQQFFSIIRAQHPKARVTFVAIKPSPSREKLMTKMEETNLLIENFLKKKRRTSFIDVYHAMLLANGKPDPSLFLSDNLHMNAKGYAIWTKIIEPYLIKR
jgi:lysophospholipase L1-like esterase